MSVNARLVRAATYASVGTALVMATGKGLVWGVTDSAAMFGGFLDSFLDVLASLLTFAAVRISQAPASGGYRFGYGKAEALSALGQAGMISAAAVLLGLESWESLRESFGETGGGGASRHGVLGLSTAVAAVCLTGCLLWFQRYVSRRTGSLAILADSLHYKGDMLLNLSVAASFGAALLWGSSWFDGACGFGISLWLMWGATGIFRKGWRQALDGELGAEARAKIRETATGVGQVEGVHDVRTRASGLRTFIQLHLELDGAMTLLEAHKISDEVEERLSQEFPGSEILIHQDPAGLEPKEHTARKWT